MDQTKSARDAELNPDAGAPVLEVAEPAPKPGPKRKGDGHLFELDIVRIVTFAGVIFDHCVSGTTTGANVASNAIQTFFHYTRNAFFALTGFVLVYQYRHRKLHPIDFWRRRYKAVGLPYLTWTVFFWLYDIYSALPPQYTLENIPRVFSTWPSAKDALDVLVHDTITGSGSYHLYFVFVTMQVYLIFPFLLQFLRWTMGYHKYLLAVSFAFHLVLLNYMTGVPPRIVSYEPFATLWAYLPGTIFPYQFFTLLGCVAAMHLEGVRAWFGRFRGRVITVAIGVIVVTLLYYGYLAGFVAEKPPHEVASVFQPFPALMFIAIIAMLYAAGTYWSDYRTAGSFWDRFLATASDRSFGIFLVHPFALNELAPTIHRFRFEVYPPLVTACTFLLTVLLTVAISEVLRRTPVSLWTTGRKMIPMRKQSPTVAVGIGVAMIVVGALFAWPLDVPAGVPAVFLGAVLVVWQGLGRTVFAGPAGARPLPAKV